MFGTIERSWDMMKHAADVLRQDRELVVFPIVSGIVSLVVLASFAFGAWSFGFFEDLETDNPPAAVTVTADNAPTAVAPADGKESINYVERAPEFLFAFAFYCVSYFVVIYFNACLIGAAHIRLQGGDPTVADGFRIANQCLPAIIGYAIFAATVGTILKAIRDNSDNLIARIIGGLIGMAWTLITFLVVPVIVIERVGPWQAIKRSTSLLRKTWGEQVVSNIGFGLISLLFMLPGLALLLGGFFVAAMYDNLALVGIGLCIVAVLYWILLAVVMSALQGIFVAALYSYANDEPTGSIPRELIAGAFRVR